ncbi:hypothetical protein [Paludisphaera soli]|uniref:hypothetical protein n=1 Tax=Paludisphaera soli TaxID=2712865 RepID=UPI0013EBD854|nr:hypothetical protein [Paludisphaera soli]
MSSAPRRRAWSTFALACAMAGPGCSQFSSRQRIEESRRYIQALRSENDQLKDQVLAYRNQNQDFSERAVDDARRLAVQADVIDDQKRSIHAYQAEREDLKTAFRQVRDSLPSAVRSAMSDAGSRIALDGDRGERDTPPDPEPAAREERRKPVPTGHESSDGPRGGWGPALEEAPGDEPGLDPSP